MKQQIIELRLKGKTYNEIKCLLNVSKATISYHLKNAGLETKIERLSISKIEELQLFYKDHTINECAIKFNISKTTVIRFTDNKRIKLTEEDIKAKNYIKVKSHRKKIKEKLVDYKGGSCELCHYNKCIEALEFHHRDPAQKDFGISEYTHLKWDNIVKEVDKCIMVCANCHREIHNGILLP
jgi:DNA-binding CsgD family transcriptional regulator